MNEKAVGHQRALLLKIFLKKNLSESTEIVISKIIKGSKDRDKKAQTIREMIETSKTEQEILQKLKNLED